MRPVEVIVHVSYSLLALLSLLAQAAQLLLELLGRYPIAVDQLARVRLAHFLLVVRSLMLLQQLQRARTFRKSVPLAGLVVLLAPLFVSLLMLVIRGLFQLGVLEERKEIRALVALLAPPAGALIIEKRFEIRDVGSRLFWGDGGAIFFYRDSRVVVVKRLLIVPFRSDSFLEWDLLNPDFRRVLIEDEIFEHLKAGQFAEQMLGLA